MEKLTQKQKEYKEKMEKALNPFENFDPDNFEPLATAKEKESIYRKRIVPPKELPTFGLKPKEIMEGQMIGMYESKQDILRATVSLPNPLKQYVGLSTPAKSLSSNCNGVTCVTVPNAFGYGTVFPS